VGVWQNDRVEIIANDRNSLFLLVIVIFFIVFFQRGTALRHHTSLSTAMNA